MSSRALSIPRPPIASDPLDGEERVGRETLEATEAFLGVRDAHQRCVAALSLAAAASVRGAPVADVGALLARAARWALARHLSPAHLDARVHVRDGERTLTVSVLGPQDLEYPRGASLTLATAALVPSARYALVAAYRMRTRLLPQPYWPEGDDSLDRAYASLVVGAADRRALGAARWEIREARGREARRLAERAPLLALMEQLADGPSPAAWTRAVADALSLHAVVAQRLPRALDWIAFAILGLCALAAERGVRPDVASPYLPPELFERGPAEHVLGDVTLAYPSIEVADANEATWVMDTCGFDRAPRVGAEGQIRISSTPVGGSSASAISHKLG